MTSVELKQVLHEIVQDSLANDAIVFSDSRS